MLQSSQKSSPKNLVVYVMCPGLSKSEISMSFDKKQGTLDIIGESTNKDLNDVVDISIEGTIEIPAKYRCKPSSKVNNGILSVTFGLTSDVDSIEIE